MTYPFSDCCPNLPGADPGCDDGWCCTHETHHETEKSAAMDDDERTPHERHVAAGHCAVISGSKAWCDRPAGHFGLHSSPRVPHPSMPVSPTNPARVAWDG